MVLLGLQQPRYDQRLVVAHLDGRRLQPDEPGVRLGKIAVSCEPAALLTLLAEGLKRLAVFPVLHPVEVHQSEERTMPDTDPATLDSADRARRAVEVATHLLGRQPRHLAQRPQLFPQLKALKGRAFAYRHGNLHDYSPLSVHAAQPGGKSV